jgi:hypothetical protein
MPVHPTSTLLDRSLPGEFQLKILSGGCWRIDNLAPPQESLWLRGVDAGAAAPPRFDRLTVVWQSDGRIGITLAAGGEAVTVGAQTALLHEPCERLYDSLPLLSYTPRNARFWRRVFRLVRIPGGRLLLSWLARRSRSGV